MNVSNGGRRAASSAPRRQSVASCLRTIHIDADHRVQRVHSMKLRQWIGRVALVSIAWLASPIQSAVQAADFLDPEDAFRFSATVAEDGRSVAARFSIADGYYLYHERFAFAAVAGGVEDFVAAG